MKKYGFVFLSAILITLSVYPFDFSFLAFFFFVPAFYGILKSQTLKEKILLSVFFGVSIFVLNFFWSVKTMEFYGRISPFLSYSLAIPLSIYQTSPFILFLLFFPYLYRKNIFLPAVFFPLLTNFLPLVFPYSISSTLSSTPFLCQTTALWGEWGLDFLIVLTNILLFTGIYKKEKARVFAGFGIIFFLVFYGLSSNFLSKPKFSQKEKFTIIQPCILDRETKRQKEKKFFKLLAKIEDKAQNSILVIPESSLPDSIAVSPQREEILKEIIKKLKLKAILYNATIVENGKIYNSEILLSSNSRDRYDKKHLMLFGEYFPLHSLLQKLPLYAANFANFTEGKKAKTLTLGNIKIATPICLEAIYQNYTAKLSSNSQIIVNPTDDEWFLSNKAKMLHFAQSRLKAIENGRYFLRATNNGFTAIVNPYGKISKKLEIDKQGYLTAELPLISEKTLFQKTYFLFPYLFSFVFLILLGISVYYERKSNNS